MADPEVEYEICQRRGHEPSGVSMTMGWETWQQCKWCNTEYRYGEPRLIERETSPLLSALDFGAHSTDGD